MDENTAIDPSQIAGEAVEPNPHGLNQRHERVKKYLRQKARALAPGAAIPSTVHLLRDLNVARATITRAIKDLQAEGILIGKRGSGVYTTKRATLSTVAFVTRWSAHELGLFEQTVVDAIIQYAPSYGMFAEFFPLSDYEKPDVERTEHFYRLAAQGRFAAILSLSGEIIPAWRSDLEQLNIPLVINPITMSNSLVISYGLDFLQLHGCSRIALIEWKAPAENLQSYFSATLAQRGLEFNPERVIRVPYALSLELAGYRAFAQMWNRWKEKPDGLISNNDRVTQGVASAAVDLGIDIPGQLRVVTQANKGMPIKPGNGILRMEVDVELYTKMMLEKLRDRIAGVKEFPPTYIPLNPILGDEANTQVSDTLKR